MIIDKVTELFFKDFLNAKLFKKSLIFLLYQEWFAISYCKEWFHAFYELELILIMELSDTLCEKGAIKQCMNLRYKMITGVNCMQTVFKAFLYIEWTLFYCIPD